ncbi:MAG TPA: choice-of-anchor tandem repeat GloVer-containing protein [Verrucomicrobiae bacterium]|nr:choice-of-anchor tandem repeat GloVer-containing protein [Verrucomicrobiae bacterium]
MSRFIAPKIVCFLFVFGLAVSLAAPAQVFRSLVNFNWTLGAGPEAGLIRGTDGNFYGSTVNGGSSLCSGEYIGCGIVFKVTPGGVFEPVYTFCQSSCADGAQPTAPLVQGSDGNFYGTTYIGGTGDCFSGCGTVFKLTPTGVLTTLYTFCSQEGCPDGELPFGGIVLGPDGNFYGTTAGGGGGNCWIGCGTIFRITPGGTFTTLYTFSGSDGSNPYAGLLLGTDGNLYGVTSSGGTQQGYGGTVFKITPSGALTTLYIFCSQNLPCSDGAYPVGTLVQGADGNFYGTTEVGGDPECPIDEVGCGTTFKITPTGTLTTLHVFNGNDGADLLAGLALGYDGNFYGAAAQGGAFCNSLGQSGCGTVFRMTPAGTLTVLHNFNGSDGSYPAGALLVADDGNLYGTTAGGGSGYGTVFSLSSTTISYDLDVSTGGTGTVTSTDGFINCPGTCTHPYSPGIPVTMNATPAPGWTFSSWSGACSGNGSCSVTMNQSQSVRAVFVQGDYNLTVSMSGQGSITSTDGYINCPGTCSHTYFSLTPVTLNAHPAQGWNFSGWSGACTGVGPCSLSMSENLGASAYFFQPGSGLQFVPITPCRLLDTRSSGGPIPGGSYQTYNLPALAQTNGCANLSSAVAYSLNVTLVPQNGPVSYLTIWPAGLAQPVTSTMNSDGRVKANAAIVPAGVSAGVDVYVANTTNLLLDIDGYFTAPSSSTLKFYPVTPCRLADTRSSNYPPGLGTPNLSGGVARDFPVLSSSCIPSGVTPAAYSLNLTAIPYPQGGDRLGYLEIWPTGQQPQNPVSTLNNPTGTNVANAAIVPAGTGGSITAFPSDDTNLAIDINGYFASSGTGGLSLYPAPPCRVFDSRGVGNGQPFSGTLSPPINVAGSVCAPPSGALGYVFNATVVPSPTLSYLTLWPDSEGQPTVSTLNAGDGSITSNMAILANGDGKIDAYAQGATQLILDISAYFAP